MKKTKLLVALLVAVLFVFTFVLTACPTEPDPDPTPGGTTKTTIELSRTNGATGISSLVLDDFLSTVASNQGNGWKGELYSYYRNQGWSKQLNYYNSMSGFPASGAVTGISVSGGNVTYNYSPNTVINAAIGYQAVNSAITFRSLTGTIQMATGTYGNGDLKPAWEELQRRLGVTFVDSFAGGLSSQNEAGQFNHWASNNYVDQTNGLVNILIGNLSTINEAGRKGDLVNLLEYLDYMPNFKAFLEANPLTYLSLLADTATGAFYTIPYFDGYDDMERYPMMQVEMVAKLLNGSGAFASSKTAKAMNTTTVYQPYMPTSGQVEIEVANAAGTDTTTIEKDYDAVLAHFVQKDWYKDGESGNLVDIANAYRKSTGATYVGLVNVLREYIDIAYDGHYANNRADLFTGVNSAWDADELVVLLHCVIGNAYEFNDDGEMVGFFARNNSSNDRIYDLIRLGAQLFGVRGMESRVDYLHFDSEGNLVDARQTPDAYELAIRLNAMYQEGLVDSEYNGYVQNEAASSTNRIKENKGFMMYDYVQTQAAKNSDVSSLQPVVTPVALWYDGTNIVEGEDQGVWMRFTESWRAVKTTGAAITKATITENPDAFVALLKMVDYFYTFEGRVLMTYGPDEYIQRKAGAASGATGMDAWETFSYNGEQHPVIAENVISPEGEFYWNQYTGVGLSFTNYGRLYLGTTLCLTEKMQSFEYQLTDDQGKAGSIKVATANGLGLINHVILSVPTGANANWWYVSTPVTIAQTTNQDNVMKEDMIQLIGDNQYFNTASGTTRYNLFIEIVVAKSIVRTTVEE